MEPIHSNTHAPLARRSFLQYAGAGGLALGMVLSGAGIAEADDGGGGSPEQVVRQVLHVIESRDTAAIWAFFGDAGVVEFPFLGLRFASFAEFDAGVGPLLAALDGLTYTEPVFERLDDRDAVIAKYKGHATVNFTGKPYNQTYITEVHLRHRMVTSWAEYFDTAVLNEAFTP
jgi:ketosteroid isomerase-like protein